MDNRSDPSVNTGAEPHGPAPAGPDIEATHPPDAPFAASVARPHASENAEREAALRRGRERRMRAEDDDEDGGGAAARRKAIWAANPAFAALADNVRDYAIFLLDPQGIITFWGEGAHLMKWWTMEEAEGAHLRLLYPEGGAEDGTAEDHLREAEVAGEFNGEGRRVRRDGSTFWAGVNLTALRDPEGELLGFAKNTRDLTARRAAESAVAIANAAQAARDVALELAKEAQKARERAEEAAEFAQEHARGSREYISRVLEPELAQERALRASLTAELEARHADRDPPPSIDPDAEPDR